VPRPVRGVGAEDDQVAPGVLRQREQQPEDGVAVPASRASGSVSTASTAAVAPSIRS
jgi:hypothetical protein